MTTCRACSRRALGLALEHAPSAALLQIAVASLGAGAGRTAALSSSRSFFTTQNPSPYPLQRTRRVARSDDSGSGSGPRARSPRSISPPSRSRSLRPARRLVSRQDFRDNGIADDTGGKNPRSAAARDGAEGKSGQLAGGSARTSSMRREERMRDGGRDGASERIATSSPLRNNLRSTRRRTIISSRDLFKTDKAEDGLISRDAIRTQRHIKLELVYLKDPKKLEAAVRKHLKRGDEVKALGLTRTASKSMKTSASWNCIIDYFFQQSRPADAWKLFQDMKKRGQKPDGHTYIFLLRGFADNAHIPLSVTRARAIFESMKLPTSTVSPLVVHLNLLLKVAARSNNISQFFSIFESLEDKDLDMVDALSYTTIFNALRYSIKTSINPSKDRNTDVKKGEAAQPLPRQPDDEAIALVTQRISEARKIWRIFVKKWRESQVVMDEGVACSMGRVLLASPKPKDWDDVFSLMNQSMGIRRAIPALGSPGSHNFLQASTSNPEAQQTISDDHNPKQTLVAKETDGQSHNDVEVDQQNEDFAYVRMKAAKGKQSKKGPSFAAPSNNTLSLLQEASLYFRSKRASDAYWEILTNPDTHNVVPDIENVHARLRVLRIMRSGREALDLLKKAFVPVDSPQKGYGLVAKGSTFRIALAACTRNPKNPNSLDQAAQMMDVMLQSLPDADLQSAYAFSVMLHKAPVEIGLYGAALHLENLIPHIRSQLAFGIDESREEEQKAVNRENKGTDKFQRLVFPKAKPIDYESRLTGFMIMQNLVSTYHRLQNNSDRLGLTDIELSEINEFKRRIDAALLRYRTRTMKYVSPLGGPDTATSSEDGGDNSAKGRQAAAAAAVEKLEKMRLLATRRIVPNTTSQWAQRKRLEKDRMAIEAEDIEGRRERSRKKRESRVVLQRGVMSQFEQRRRENSPGTVPASSSRRRSADAASL